MLEDIQNILNRWKNYFNQFLNINGVNAIRQAEMHTAEPSVLKPSPLEVKTATEKLKIYKLSCSDQIPAELIQAGGNTLYFDFHILINSFLN
jgi:hypothetical protein